MKSTRFLAAFALAATAALLSASSLAEQLSAVRTQAEMMGIPASGHYTSFRELDANRDGYITREEARDSPALIRRFSEVDRDGDGRISHEEQRDWSFVGPMVPRR